MQSVAIKLKLIHFNGCRPLSVSIPLRVAHCRRWKTVRERKLKAICVISRSLTRARWSQRTLKNLHLAFKSLIREPLKGRLKSKIDHQTLKVFLKVSGSVVGEVCGLATKERRDSAACPRASKVVSSLNLSVSPVPLWNSNTGACLLAKHN